MEEVKGSNPFRATETFMRRGLWQTDHRGRVRMNPGTEQIVAKLTGVLIQAAQPKRIILFGSQARGDAATHSDFDIMVVEEHPPTDSRKWSA